MNKGAGGQIDSPLPPPPPPSPPKKQTNTVGWLVAHNKIKSTKIVVDNTIFLQLKISNKRKKHNIKICGTSLIKNIIQKT